MEQPTVSLRPLAASDFPQMAAWLTDPRVLEWYHGRDDPHDLAKVAAEYGRAASGEGLGPGFRSIIELDGRPIGYLQCYAVTDAAEYGIHDATGVWAADLFLGDPDLWSRGLGPRALRIAVDEAFARRGASRFVIDPRVDNARAIRAYEKSGFRKVRVLPAHEMHEGALHDAWLMEFERGA